MKKIYNKITINFLILVLIYLPRISVFADSDNPSEIEREDESFSYMITGGTRNNVRYLYVKYLISLRTRRPTKYFGDNHFCAGVIIGHKKILTAAHCVMDGRKVLTRVRHLLVVAGTPNRLHIANTTRQVGVDKVIPHYNYVMSNTDDIALIILHDALPHYNNAIQIMPLPTTPPIYAMNCTIIGWGRMYHKGPLAATTITAEVFLLTPPVCIAKTKFIKLDHKMLCTANQATYTTDPCMGDIGGPLICGGNLTGIVSWTIGCGSTTLPSLYTDVYRHLQWIRENKSRHLPNCARLSTIFLLIILVAILS